jgi:hemolysin activation/secretion protein
VPVNGVIRIAVLEGRLDEVILNWPDKMPVDRAVVEAYLARLEPGEILRVRDVERIVFLVKDLRGLNARFEVKAGRTPGTASLVVTAQPEERRATARVEVDSLGLALFGRLARNVQAMVASPAGRGDGLVVNVLSSFTRRA